jgi:hypothetical protein
VQKYPVKGRLESNGIHSGYSSSAPNRFSFGWVVMGVILSGSFCAPFGVRNDFGNMALLDQVKAYAEKFLAA